MKILFILARGPGGRQTGGKAVINTAVHSLLALGHDVEVAVIARRVERSPAWPLEVQVHWFDPPRFGRVVGNILTKASSARLSLNECLFASPRLLRSIRDLGRRGGFDLVVADMLRSFPAAEATGLPMILHLVDLLSERYRTLTRSSSDGRSVLGYYRASLPAGLTAPMEWAAGRALGVEAKLIGHRELVAARHARVVALVDQAEADRFSLRAGRNVFAAPMAVTMPANGERSTGIDDLVFLGGLDYHPNLEAVRWFAGSVIPELDRLGLDRLRLHVIGFCSDAQRAELGSDRLVLHGYVDDVNAELGSHTIMVAPIRSGTGIKTKVVQAMALRMPVVATTMGVSGVGVIDGEHAWVSDDSAAFARSVADALHRPGEARRRGERGRELVEKHFAPEIIGERWRTMIAAALCPVESRSIRALFYNDYPMDQAFDEWRRGLYPGQHLFGVTHMGGHGVDVEIMPFGPGSRLRDFLYRAAGDPQQQLRVLARALTGRHDVIYAAGSYNSVLLAMLRRVGILRTPLVGTVHHLARGPLRRPWIYRFFFGGHDRLLCMSEEIYAELVNDLAFSKVRAVLVGWAVDLDLYQPSWPVGPAGPLVISAGKTKRDFQTLVDAFSGLPCSLEVYCSANSAPDETRAGSNVSVHYDESHVSQAAALSFSDLLARYRSCTAVAIPLPASEARGTTGLTSLLEALAMGRGVLMTRNSFLDIEELRVGARVEPGDVEGWRNVLRRLVDDPAWVEEMGRRGRRLCEERFGLDDYAARVAGVLIDVSQDRGSSRRRQGGP